MDNNIITTDKMLSTIDNPYNPFTQFDDWLNYDEQKGHYTLQLLARIAEDTSNLSEIDENFAIDDAILRIIKLNLPDNHIVVKKTHEGVSKISTPPP